MTTILTIDDSNFSRQRLRRSLEPAGFNVVEASTGAAGLVLYAELQPDVVLLDLTMAGMTGYETLRKLRELDPHARVIVVTADIQSTTSELVNRDGAAGFIGKPFTDEAVVAAVNAALENHKAGV